MKKLLESFQILKPLPKDLWNHMHFEDPNVLLDLIQPEYAYYVKNGSSLFDTTLCAFSIGNETLKFNLSSGSFSNDNHDFYVDEMIDFLFRKLSKKKQWHLITQHYNAYHLERSIQRHFLGRIESVCQQTMNSLLKEKLFIQDVQLVTNTSDKLEFTFSLPECSQCMFEVNSNGYSFLHENGKYNGNLLLKLNKVINKKLANSYENITFTAYFSLNSSLLRSCLLPLLMETYESTDVYRLRTAFDDSATISKQFQEIKTHNLYY